MRRRDPWVILAAVISVPAVVLALNALLGAHRAQAEVSVRSLPRSLRGVLPPADRGFKDRSVLAHAGNGLSPDRLEVLSRREQGGVLTLVASGNTQSEAETDLREWIDAVVASRRDRLGAVIDRRNRALNAAVTPATAAPRAETARRIEASSVVDALRSDPVGVRLLRVTDASGPGGLALLASALLGLLLGVALVVFRPLERVRAGGHEPERHTGEEGDAQVGEQEQQ